MRPGNLISLMWILWAAYWLLLSRNVKVTARTEPTASRLMHVLPLSLAGILLAMPRTGVPLLDARFIARGWWPFWIGTALCASGMLFSVWARRHIGSNWSGIVTLKQDHVLVQSGPYAIVRHPIYTGLLLALAGTALARGEWRGVLALAIAFAALWRKLRFEERWMREQFGERYAAYSQRVAALIPYVL